VWERTKKAWIAAVQYAEGFGILSAEVLPTKNALIPLVVMADRHPGALRERALFGWFLHATRAGRYSGSAITTLDQDVRVIMEADSTGGAIGAIRSKLMAWASLNAQDFMENYRDRFLRLLLYLAMYERGARDWMSKQRLGFQGKQLLERFNPNWHHIFPRAYLRRMEIPEDLWDVFANIAVVSPGTNIKFGAKDPMAYLDRYQVDDELLDEQLVPTDRELLTVERYKEFLDLRAEALAKAANDYFEGLLSDS
jgi:hypothetical protein